MMVLDDHTCHTLCDGQVIEENYAPKIFNPYERNLRRIYNTEKKILQGGLFCSDRKTITIYRLIDA